MTILSRLYHVKLIELPYGLRRHQCDKSTRLRERDHLLIVVRSPVESSTQPYFRWNDRDETNLSSSSMTFSHGFLFIQPEECSLRVSPFFLL